MRLATRVQEERIPLAGDCSTAATKRDALILEEREKDAAKAAAKAAEEEAPALPAAE